MQLNTEPRLDGTPRGVRAAGARLALRRAGALAPSSAAFGSVIYEFDPPASALPSLDPP